MDYERVAIAVALGNDAWCDVAGNPHAIEATYRDMVRCLGEPGEGDGYKVVGEWYFNDGSGNVFSLYDWKATSLYDPKLPSPESFREKGIYSFHIGSRGKGDPYDFEQWVNAKLGAKAVAVSMNAGTSSAELERAIAEFESAQENLRLATERFNKAVVMRDQALRANR